MFWYLIQELIVEVIKAGAGVRMNRGADRGGQCHRSRGNCGGGSVVLREEIVVVFQLYDVEQIVASCHRSWMNS